MEKYYEIIPKDDDPEVAIVLDRITDSAKEKMIAARTDKNLYISIRLFAFMLLDLQTRKRKSILML